MFNFFLPALSVLLLLPLHSRFPPHSLLLASPFPALSPMAKTRTSNSNNRATQSQAPKSAQAGQGGHKTTARPSSPQGASGSARSAPEEEETSNDAR